MDSLFQSFKTRAEAVSAEVHRFAKHDDALGFVTGFLHGEGVSDTAPNYAAWADCPFLDGLDRQLLSRQVPGLRFEVTRELAAETKIGISQMDWAIADTGTLAQDATAVAKRLVSTLPIIHVALIATAALTPDLPSVLRKVDPRQSAYLSFITGPSRTADIERVLTIGVHGPERLVIVFVDELKGTAV
jgi:L-lactate dehydrogenase complex protein LldG